MVKINRSLLFFFLIAAIVVISGCAKAECKTSSDCLSRQCTIPTCEEKKCVYGSQPNCCGNRINESIEDGKPGNQCTCPADYGKCEGKGKVKAGARTEDAAYVRYYCSADNRCVLGVEKNDIIPQNFLDSINPGTFQASSVIKYNKPFDVAKDNFEFRIALDNTGKETVLPIRLAKIKLLFSGESARIEQLIADQDMDYALNGVGDSVKINVPLNLNYRPKEAEEAGSLRYLVDYTHKKQVLIGKVNGTNIFANETVRAAFTAPIKPVFFVRSG